MGSVEGLEAPTEVPTDLIASLSDEEPTVMPPSPTLSAASGCTVYPGPMYPGPIVRPMGELRRPGSPSPLTSDTELPVATHVPWQPAESMASSLGSVERHPAESVASSSGSVAVPRGLTLETVSTWQPGDLDLETQMPSSVEPQAHVQQQSQLRPPLPPEMQQQEQRAPTAAATMPWPWTWPNAFFAQGPASTSAARWMAVNGTWVAAPADTLPTLINASGEPIVLELRPDDPD